MQSWHISGQCLQIPSEAKCLSEQVGLHSHCSRSKGLSQDWHFMAFPTHVLQDSLHFLQVPESLKYPLLSENNHKTKCWSVYIYQTVQVVIIVSICETMWHSRHTQFSGSNRFLKPVACSLLDYIPYDCKQKTCMLVPWREAFPSFCTYSKGCWTSFPTVFLVCPKKKQTNS